MTAYEQMREALLQIVETANAWADPGADAATTIGLIIDRAEDALAIPPRQCDVGTVLEQRERQRHYCGEHYSACDVDMECCRCPLEKEASCELAWAQMPYTAEGKASR